MASGPEAFCVTRLLACSFFSGCAQPCVEDYVPVWGRILMGFRFRRSVRLLPGVRLNIGKRVRASRSAYAVCTIRWGRVERALQQVFPALGSVGHKAFPKEHLLSTHLAQLALRNRRFRAKVITFRMLFLAFATSRDGGRSNSALLTTPQAVKQSLAAATIPGRKFPPVYLCP
jgi:hypothetical protein